ncbi:MAG: class I SAM-dependent methyltransferase, partial [Halioglobus sp.]|nr:class I SAM-dependent methyltransferase [Halioglobus sp.]
APSREMALFSGLLGESSPGEDENFLRWARSQSPARVVVKRAPRAESLGRLPPSHCIAGKAVRYDVYVTRALG